MGKSSAAIRNLVARTFLSPSDGGSGRDRGVEGKADNDAGGDDDGGQHDANGYVALAQFLDFIEARREGVEDFDDDAQRDAHGQRGHQGPGKSTSEFEKDLIHARQVHSRGGTALLAGNF
jgi:hypothetical protein